MDCFVLNKNYEQMDSSLTCNINPCMIILFTFLLVVDDYSYVLLLYLVCVSYFSLNS